jgi:predicted glycogen debranching enzyme
MFLQKLEETVSIGQNAYRLSVNEYPAALFPTGFLYLEEFRLDPLPILRYHVESAVIEKEVCLVYGENTVIVQYRLLEAPESVRFTMDLLLNSRPFHSLTRETSNLSFVTERVGELVRITSTNGSTPFYVTSQKAKIRPTGFWYRNFLYAQERERGYDYHEDIYNPVQLVAELEPGDSLNVTCSVSRPPPAADSDSIISEQRERVRSLASGVEDEFMRALVKASDAFIVRRGDGASCIAGYHWFGEWGRDAMISLPGLTLVTGRFNEAKRILETYARNMSNGLIPNYFSDSDGTPQYNSLDATLWFFHAVRKYFQYTKDTSTMKALYPALKISAESLLRGTSFHVKTDKDTLLDIGQKDVQLTWMDAKIDDDVVTPRYGKAVEINALWYSALDTVSGFARLLGNQNDSHNYSDVAEEVRTSFSQIFWNPEANCLYDRNADGVPDPSMRPNQIIAVALPKPLLQKSKEKAVVDAVRSQLLTPYGLRTLSPKDPNYKGLYEGDLQSRDLAYHQGPAWPWLLGPFVKAYVKVSEDLNASRKEAAKFLDPMRAHLRETGLGYLSELFDGDSPWHPRGCIAQAWSVAEVLRAYYEDILGREPEDTLATSRE